jgi:hypothetical protein
MTLRKLLPIAVLVAAAVALLVNLTGCASWGSTSTESLLSAAGFKTQAPSTPKQWALYNNMTPFQVERYFVKGKPLYAYADKKNEVVYLGGPKAYERFKQLGFQKKIAQDELAAAELNEDAAMDWSTWGPMGGIWE